MSIKLFYDIKISTVSFRTQLHVTLNYSAGDMKYNWRHPYAHFYQIVSPIPLSSPSLSPHFLFISFLFSLTLSKFQVDRLSRSGDPGYLWKQTLIWRKKKEKKIENEISERGKHDRIS